MYSDLGAYYISDIERDRDSIWLDGFVFDLINFWITGTQSGILDAQSRKIAFFQNILANAWIFLNSGIFTSIDTSLECEFLIN